MIYRWSDTHYCQPSFTDTHTHTQSPIQLLQTLTLPVRLFGGPMILIQLLGTQGFLVRLRGPKVPQLTFGYLRFPSRLVGAKGFLVGLWGRQSSLKCWGMAQLSDRFICHTRLSTNTLSHSRFTPSYTASLLFGHPTESRRLSRPGCRTAIKHRGAHVCVCYVRCHVEVLGGWRQGVWPDTSIHQSVTSEMMKMKMQQRGRPAMMSWYQTDWVCDRSLSSYAPSDVRQQLQCHATQKPGRLSQIWPDQI